MIPTKIIHNGPRPSPLKIQKQSSSSSSISKQTRKKPVIIYDHSPKIIYTKANQFKALIQELTGLSHIQEDDHEIQSPNKNVEMESLTKEVHNDREDREGCTASSLHSVSPINPYWADIPLSTPNLAGFLCSPRLLFRSPSPSFIEN